MVLIKDFHPSKVLRTVAGVKVEVDRETRQIQIVGIPTEFRRPDRSYCGGVSTEQGRLFQPVVLNVEVADFFEEPLVGYLPFASLLLRSTISEKFDHPFL